MSKKPKRAALVMKIGDPKNVNQRGLDNFLSQAKRDSKSVIVHSDLKNSISPHNMKIYGGMLIFQEIVKLEDGGYFVVLKDINGDIKNQQTLAPYQNL